MEPAAFINKRGFTLIELMVSILILTVGLLALLQTVNLALMHNLANQLRNEAVQVADEQMTTEMAKPFSLISTNITPNVKTVTKSFANAAKSFTVTRQGTQVTASTTNVNISIGWTQRGQTYTHTINSMLSRLN